MHSFLRAIGFSNIEKRTDLNDLFDTIIEKSKKVRSTEHNKRNVILSEISKEFADGLGITLYGELDKDNVFHMEYYFPYVASYNASVKDQINFNKRVDTDAYTGMCDDYRLGVSLIFYLQNVIDYMDNYKTTKECSLPVKLSALSTEGRIILPIEKTESQVKNLSVDKNYRNNLIEEAKKGNQEAIDNLTFDDIDTYAMVSRRAKKEDVYSIVDTFFIPFGSESDNYTIMGTILNCNLIENFHTKEEIYDMDIICNDIILRVCINKDDLMGQPEIGRRFKGNIWLQGHVDFDL